MRESEREDVREITTKEIKSEKLRLNCEGTLCTSADLDLLAETVTKCTLILVTNGISEIRILSHLVRSARPIEQKRNNYDAPFMQCTIGERLFLFV